MSFNLYQLLLHLAILKVSSFTLHESIKYSYWSISNNLSYSGKDILEKSLVGHWLTAAILDDSIKEPLHELLIPGGLSVHCMCVIVGIRFFRKKENHADKKCRGLNNSHIKVDALVTGFKCMFPSCSSKSSMLGWLHISVDFRETLPLLREKRLFPISSMKSK